MSKQNVGVGLVALGLVLALAVIPLWSTETRETDRDRQANRYAEAITGQPFDDPEPDRTLPIAVGAVSAVLFLAGVIVLVSPSPDS